MTSDGHPPENETFDRQDSAESTAIYPLVDAGNRRVRREWLSDHESYVIADEKRPVTITLQRIPSDLE